MRIRTLLSFATGAAVGAGWMYLADPDHGPQRRRDARRSAFRQARLAAVALAAEGRRRVEEYVHAAAAGFQQGRVEGRPDEDDSPTLRAVDDRRAS
jgi:hypothetical protein